MSWKNKKSSSLLKALLFLFPYLLVIVLFIITPIIIVTIFAFSKDENFNLINFNRFFTEKENLKILFSTIGIALFSTFICLIVGLPAAWFISRLSNSGRFLVLGLIAIILSLNMILKLKAFNIIFINNGVLEKFFNLFVTKNYKFRTDWPIIVAGQVFIFIPFMIIAIYNSIIKIDKDVIVASYDLGSNKVQTFFKIYLPLIYPGIRIGLMLVFLSASTSISFSLILTDGNVALLGKRIAKLYQTQKEYTAAISILSVIIILLLFSISNYWTYKYNPNKESVLIKFKKYIYGKKRKEN